MQSPHPPAWIDDFLSQEGLPHTYALMIQTVVEPLATRIQSAKGKGLFVMGICGAQGSGKSTLTAALAKVLEIRGVRVVTLSLDDLYLSRAERQALAGKVHPLLATRGVPGTHNVQAGLQLLQALSQEGRVRLPRFDKAMDDPLPQSALPEVASPVDVVLFEGWCVGARPQPVADLVDPINHLEADHDHDGRWRGFVNAQLQGPYAQLFSRLDALVFLQAPSFDVVAGWRLEQENKLRERLRKAGVSIQGLMDDAAVRRFVAHYERVTRALQAEAPQRADVLIRLQADRSIEDIVFN